MAVATVDDYIGKFDGEVGRRLNAVRTIVREELPEAEERLSYGIPACFLNNRVIIYYSAFKNHLGIYPGRLTNDSDRKLAGKYLHGKSTLRFPHDQPLPVDVIRTYILSRAKEVQS